MRHVLNLPVIIALGVVTAQTASAVDLVIDGKPVATIVSDSRIEPPAPPVKGKPRGKPVPPSGEALATQLLADWIKKITDAELPIADKATSGAPVIYVGKAAVSAGLKLDDIDSPTREGVRIVVEGNRVLIAGQSDDATLKAVARFLEELGCRYFMDGPLGEVFPRSKNLAMADKTITETPGLQYRNPKGPTFNAALWKAWNGAGGEPFQHSHSWGGYLEEGLFEKHPEYFALGADGARKDGDWLCTSNPELRQYFAEQVIKRIRAGEKHPSISPTDGGGYCQCEKCKAQDDPNVIEPSSNTVAVSNRYADFFDDVGRRVAKEEPDAILSFYVYANYTQVPSFKNRKLSPNLVAMVAPIRYCRLHGIGDPNCPSRHQQLSLMDGWSNLASKIGYYNYMYNLADATLPMFKFTPCKTEFPYLADKGLTYMTIEVLSNWYLYGPQIYLSLRQAYDPKLDATALMEDYYTKFYGPAAAPMKAYWMGIDEATAKLDCHSGGFYGLGQIYTPEFIQACQSRLKQAADAAAGDPVYAERVAMHASGFQNVLDYRAIEAAMAEGDFAGPREIFNAMTLRIDGLAAKLQANREYGTAYLNRFLSKAIDGGLAATAAPNMLVQVLPDEWKVALDDKDEGEAGGFAAPAFDDGGWKRAATYSASLNAQGIESNSVIWYRTKLALPDGRGPLSLVFTEVDGKPVSVFVNGKLVEGETILKPAVKPAPKGKGNAPAPPSPAGVARRAPFEVKLDDAPRSGEITIAVKVDNRTISELDLGGILRPVLLVERGANAAK